MRSSRRSGSLVAVRALAMLAIGSGLVVGLATAAEAKPINSVKGLKSSCAKGNGTFSQVGKSAICDLPGGKTVYCNDKKKKGKCTVVDTIARELVVEDSVRAPNGVKLTTPGVPDSQVWNNRANVAVLGDVCASLGGDFIASADGTLGACGTPTATIVCQDTSATCAGVAREKVVRHLLELLIDSVASCRGSASTTPSPPQPTVTSSTTTTSAPTTTVPPTTTTTDPMLQ